MEWFAALGDEPGWVPSFHGLEGQLESRERAVLWRQHLATDGPFAVRSRATPDDSWGPILFEGSAEPVETFEALHRAVYVWIGRNDDPPFFVSSPHPAFRKSLYGRESA